MLRLRLLLLALIMTGCAANPQPPSRCELWIRGGEVIDGSGAKRRRADVLVDGGRIVYVGDVTTIDADSVIDATGLCVAPGFVDPHAHGDPRRTPGFANFCCMGVTTMGCRAFKLRSGPPEPLHHDDPPLVSARQPAAARPASQAFCPDPLPQRRARPRHEPRLAARPTVASERTPARAPPEGDAWWDV